MLLPLLSLWMRLFVLMENISENNTKHNKLCVNLQQCQKISCHTSKNLSHFRFQSSPYIWRSPIFNKLLTSNSANRLQVKDIKLNPWKQLINLGYFLQKCLFFQVQPTIYVEAQLLTRVKSLSFPLMNSFPFSFFVHHRF